MRPGHVFIAALSFSLTQHAKADMFYLKDHWSGSDFFQGWIWFTEDDPTHGRVNYVSQDEAASKHLAYGMFCSRVLPLFKSFDLLSAEGGKFIMRTDDWSTVNTSSLGRDSVRIYSENAYDEAIFVLDLVHMPAGCATWPAFWTLSEAGSWPAGGEIDIIEGMHSPISLVPISESPMRAPPPLQVSTWPRKIMRLCTLLQGAQCPLLG